MTLPIMCRQRVECDRAVTLATCASVRRRQLKIVRNRGKAQGGQASDNLHNLYGNSFFKIGVTVPASDFVMNCPRSETRLCCAETQAMPIPSPSRGGICCLSPRCSTTAGSCHSLMFGNAGQILREVKLVIHENIQTDTC